MANLPTFLSEIMKSKVDASTPPRRKYWWESGYSSATGTETAITSDLLAITNASQNSVDNWALRMVNVLWGFIVNVIKEAATYDVTSDATDFGKASGAKKLVRAQDLGTVADKQWGKTMMAIFQVFYLSSK